MAVPTPARSGAFVCYVMVGVLYAVGLVVLAPVLGMSIRWDTEELTKQYAHKCYVVRSYGHPRPVDCQSGTACSTYEMTIEVRRPTCGDDTIVTKRGMCNDALTCAAEYALVGRQVWCVSTDDKTCPSKEEKFVVFLTYDPARRLILSTHNMPRFYCTLLVFVLAASGFPIVLYALRRCAKATKMQTHHEMTALTETSDSN